MKRIEYGGKVPSWSWMAYEGGIQFTEDKFSDLDLFVDLRFDQSGALIAKAWEFKDCHVKRQTQDGTHPQILDSNEVKRGWIVYDVEDGEDCSEERGVVVARTEDGSEYYMLVVKGMKTGEYERVGMGKVQTDYISRQEPNVRIS